MSDDANLRETLASRERLYKGNYIDLLLDEVVDAHGGRHQREVVVHPGAVAMVALQDDGSVLMVRQHRHAAGETLLEIPAGTLDYADDGTREEPSVAAARELIEETGYRASTWRPLGSFFTAPGFATEEMFLYLATDLEAVADYGGPAPDEILELVPLAWAEALAMAERGEIRDAKSLVGLFRVDALMRAGELASDG